MTGAAATTASAIPGAPDNRHVFHTLDGLRGIAAVLVVAWHADLFLGATYWPASAYLAVDLFFVLSGFVIAHAYDRRFAAGLGWGTFTLARLIRFYPLFLAGVTIGFVKWALAAAAGMDPATPQVMAGNALQFFFIPSLPTGRALFPLNPPAWSLFAELLVNVVFALFWRRMTTRVLIVLVAAGALGLLATAVFEGSLNSGWGLRQMGSLAARVTFGFFAGVLLYRLYQAGRRGFPVTPILLFGLLAALMFGRPAEGYRALYDCAVVLIACPLIVWTAAASQVKGASLAFSRFFGQTSYAVYIIHAPILALIATIDGKLLGRALEAHRPWSGVALIALLLLAAWVADVIYDRPIRKWLSKRLVAPRLSRRAAAARAD